MSVCLMVVITQLMTMPVVMTITGAVVTSISSNGLNHRPSTEPGSHDCIRLCRILN